MPKSTAVAPVKPVPLIVTGCRRPLGPLVGLTEVTVGATVIGELVGWRVVGRGAVGGGHGDVHGAGARRRDRP